MAKLFSEFLKRLVKHGNMVIEDADGTSRAFGDGHGPRYTLVFGDKSVARDLMLQPELRFAELYMDGRWWLTEGDLAGLLTMLFENMDTGTIPLWRQAMHRGLRRLRQRNDARSARRNAHHHYDVGNDIYELFLDEDWQYSCGYFPRPDVSLEEAQLAKKRHIAAKMLLEDGQRVLDIGCGWGGMGLYLAKHTNADVTGITLADEQLARARARAGSTPNVEFRLQDYRDVNERFDRIVSVGMFEHVGVGYFRQYFEAVKRLLTDDGVMMLHSIGRNGPPGYTAPFIEKYIFPGGYIPSLSEVLPVIESVGLYVTDIEIWRLHYAETLKGWGERFTANREKVIALRDERFYRMWEFYLAGSEAAFRSGDMMVFQIQLAKSQTTVPLTRDYITETEHALAARDGRHAGGPALVAQSR